MNIIAVDDEKPALEMLIDSIEQTVLQTTVHGFSKPSDAITYVKENGCDIAFLDIEMCGMTGLELARRIKDICNDANIIFVTGYSEYTLDAFRVYASDYLLKPVTPDAVSRAIKHLRTPVIPKETNKIKFQCFGNFEVFCDGKPVVFKRVKAKELLAYLVDRMGAGVTMGELRAVLWEDGDDTLSRQSNLRNLISEIKKTFAELDSDSVIIKNRNTIAINRDAVECDYYDFLKHIPYAVNCYHGEYMMQYSWAEITTASLPII